MDEKAVPYIVYEGAEARAERHIKRLIIALITAIVLMFLSNALWLYEWSQYDYSSYEVSTDEGGNANYIGNDGEISYGIGSSSQES
jgi:multisubunit Na+/H+ antiporter MnhB subunit